MALVLLAVMLGAAPSALASPRASDPSPLTKLAHRYSPVVRLENQQQSCDRGEPYEPTSVDAVLGNPEVALRGPWSGSNLVKVGPTAADLSVGLTGYALDYPGNALRPGCTYADWAQRIQAHLPSTVYAHVVTQPGFPGKLALQYWFFYVYNDFNDKHEGDWEMIQLDFKADTVAQALAEAPYETGYSQHEGAERADWGDSKLQLVNGTHPVVYPAYGSHADYYSTGLYLGRSAAEGVGCDNTLGPSRQIEPGVVVIPTSPADYLKSEPWLGYLGRWGEPHPGFDNGPTGPNLKPRWTAPFTWVDESWRDSAFALPGGDHLARSATSFFCSAVAAGSDVVTLAFGNPTRVLVVLLALLILAIWLVRRTRWGPSQPFRLRRRRPWGAVITSALRLYGSRPRLFLGIGVLFIPLGLLAAGAQYLIFKVGPLAPLVQSAGESNSAVSTLVAALGLVVTIIGFAVVQAATTIAVVRLDRSEPINARAAYRLVIPHLGTLVVAMAKAAVVLALLALTGIGTLVGAYLLVRWSMLAPAVVAPVESSGGPLRKSWQLTGGHWWRTASLAVFVIWLGLLIGPLIGALLLFGTDASFNIINIVAALIDTALLPFVAIATTYLYFDLTVRDRLAASEPARTGPLPAEA